MTVLQELIQKFAAVDYRELNHFQKQYLYDELRKVKTEEVQSTEDGEGYISLLRKLREALAADDKLRGENYPQLLKSILSVGEDGLYSNKLRFIFELIQNVDDCDYPSADDCNLDIRFDFVGGKIILSYNEVGFSPFNVFAITGIAEKAKNLSTAKSEIGEKGIGFKSVFGVASKVLIRSGWFSFELSTENFTIPIAVYDRKEYQHGTEMTLFVGVQAESIYRQIKQLYCTADAIFNRNPVLFLKQLTSLKLYCDSFRSMQFMVSRSAATNAPDIQVERNVEIRVDLHDYENCRETNVQKSILCSRYTYPVTYSWKACISRYEDRFQDTPTNGKKMMLQAIVPNHDYLSLISKAGTLYSFLPTQIRLAAPIACHVPFKLNASREFVDPQGENRWFADSCKFFSELLDFVYKDWSQLVREKIVFYLCGASESLICGSNEKVQCLSTKEEYRGGHFVRLPLFISDNGVYKTATEVCSFDPTDNIMNPRHVHMLMGIQKALFLPPKDVNVAKLGIETISNSHARIFRAALSNPNVTKEALDYLDSIEYEYKEAELLGQDLLTFSLPQAEEILKHQQLSELLQRRIKECIQKGKILPIDVIGAESHSLSELLPPDYSAQEAPRMVEEYLHYCGGRGILIQSDYNQFLPCRRAILLSKRNPAASFAAFCYSIDPNDTFAIRIKLRELSDKLNLYNDSSFTSPEEGLRVLRNSRLTTKESLGKNGYRRYIELIQQTGTDKGRFLHELLQNANDCYYPKDAIPTFSFNQTNNQVETRYNESGFTWENIRAITAIGESTKNNLLSNHSGIIGEKGIGFKSVFSIASTVQIFSGKYAFSLSAQEPTIPKNIAGRTKPEPGTRMIFTLKPGITLPSLKETDILYLCLCLRRLKKLKINNYEVSIAENANERIITINRRQYVFKRYTHRFTVNEDALAERKNNYREVDPEQTIYCYVPERRKEGEYPVYTGLPTKHKLKVPIAIDAPFELTTSRELIAENREKWNDIIRKEMYSAICEVMLSRRDEDREDVLRFIRFLPHRSGSALVYDNELSESQYINAYPFLEEIKGKAILPTFEPTVFAAAENDRARRYPDAIIELLHLQTPATCPEIQRSSVINVTSDRYDAAINAMSCKTADVLDVVRILLKYAEKYIQHETFRKAFYEFLYKNALETPEEYRMQLRGLSIIPVYGKTSDTTIYASWEDDNIFVKRGSTVSTDSYSILNENILQKRMCEVIFDVNINEMNAEWERNRYNEKLQRIIRGNNTESIYAFLLNEFQNGKFFQNNSLGALLALKDMVPLKNQLGEIVDSELFINEKPDWYFPVPVIQKISVHSECKEFARYLQCGSLSSVYYIHFNYHQELTEDDIECLNDKENYFTNSEEILRGFYRDGLLPDELLQKSGIVYLSMTSIGDAQQKFTFPEDPIRNIWLLKEHVRRQLEDPVKIVPVIQNRTVRMGQLSNGKTFDLSIGEARAETISRYYPEGEHKVCFCQMCKTAKPLQFIEVNNLEKLPEHYFPQLRVALCLECSKLFEALREKESFRKSYLSEIRNAIIGERGIVEIQVGPKTITFTATHLAEIQEILKGLPKEETNQDPPDNNC